jgi:hypothetical protein
MYPSTIIKKKKKEKKKSPSYHHFVTANERSGNFIKWMKLLGKEAG